MVSMDIFEDHLIESNCSHVLLNDYIDSPGSAFLQYSLDAKDSIALCRENFPTNKDGSYTDSGKRGLENLCSAILPAFMGNLAVFQKHLFAGMFEHSALLHGFDVGAFLECIEKDYSSVFSPARLAAYRGTETSIGIVLAESMQGWQYPEMVNSNFSYFGFSQNFYTDSDCRKLSVLWQLRHSIVHTGGTLTIQDSQHLEELGSWSDFPVIFNENFYFDISRIFHSLIASAVGRLEEDFRANMLDDIDRHKLNRVDKLFEVSSKCAEWLN